LIAADPAGGSPRRRRGARPATAATVDWPVSARLSGRPGGRI